MLIPLRTDVVLKRPPLTNYALISASMAVFAASLASPEVRAGLGSCGLEAGAMRWYQLLTYQFIHADFWHLAGNMWFLWVFGNSLNSKLGNWCFLAFYLAGGALAGWGYTQFSEGLLIGSSGSVAAVTMGFVVLFPRSRILFLLWFFLITTFELPALWIVLLKFVLYDNVLLPLVETGQAPQVAYGAHLFGYVFGLVVTMGLLLLGLVSRDQFDLLAVMKRWNQRREFAAVLRDPQARARAQFGGVARVLPVDVQRRREVQARLDQAAGLRARIAEALSADPPKREAVDCYEQLMILDPEQYLPRAQQLTMARLLYEHAKFPQAASAFEQYLKRYPKDSEQDQVRLLLGIIYARDLAQYEAARGHLTTALDMLGDEKRREQCRQWLDRVRTSLAIPATGPG
jgi:membrane associated rhomboid family serine protease